MTAKTAAAETPTSRMVDLYKQGHSIRRIAAELGRSYRNVHSVLTAANVTLRTKGGRSPAFEADVANSTTAPPPPPAPIRVKLYTGPRRQPTTGERRLWKLDAACQDIDPETWYDPALVADAKKVCAACPVRDRCLAFALDIAEPWGVWGGFSEAERRALARGRRPKLCRRCDLDFVPARPGGRVCAECRPRNESSIAEHRAEVTRRAAEGWPDSMIGNLIGFTADQVRYARRRWRIPAGEVARDGLQPCGTSAAARRHKRRGEPVDDLCLEAERRRWAERPSRQRKKVTP